MPHLRKTAEEREARLSFGLQRPRPINRLVRPRRMLDRTERRVERVIGDFISVVDERKPLAEKAEYERGVTRLDRQNAIEAFFSVIESGVVIIDERLHIVRGAVKLLDSADHRDVIKMRITAQQC